MSSAEPEQKKRRLVIVGGGFGGIKVALKLQEYPQFDITLISDKDHFEYHAALYRSATGWSPREVVVNLGDIFDADSLVTVVTATIKEIQPQKKIIIDSAGDQYSYDDVVFAIGRVTNYYGIKGMADNSYGLNTIADAIDLRQHLREQVADTSKKNALEFAVIGGGATGVELASELSVFVHELCRHQKIPVKKSHVTLIEASPRLLPMLSPKASKYAQWRLEKLGVDVRLNTQVTGLSGDTLHLARGSLKSQSVIWTAGSSNHHFFEENARHFHLAHNGRVDVNEYLEATEHVFVIGDNANTQYSGMAQTALADAKFVAKNFIRQTHKKRRKLYVPKRPIYAIPVGRDYAVLQWGQMVLRGYPAWLLRRVADLRFFFSFEPYRKAIRSWRSGNHRAKGYEID